MARHPTIHHLCSNGEIEPGVHCMDCDHVWVLLEELATKKCRRSIYFQKIVAIGPLSTDDLTKAAQFLSKEAAMKSPAYVHALSCYEPERVQRFQTKPGRAARRTDE